MAALIQLPEARALNSLTPDGRLLFAARVVRMFAFGLLSVVLVLYLAQQQLSEAEIGFLLSWTLIGDATISLAITFVADRLGRRRMLMIGAGLMILAGLTLALTNSLLLLVLAAIVGTLSPGGSEVGAFLSIEQAALPQTTQNEFRTGVFAWYNLVGSFSTALGALLSGAVASALQQAGYSPLASYRVIIGVYALLGVALFFLFTRLSHQVEAQAYVGTGTDATQTAPRFGLHRSRNVVLRLAGIFALDAFGGGLVLQSVIAYWFHRRYGVDVRVIGEIFFGANFLAGLSALAAGRLAARIGLINTMVWTHIPSNLLLMLVPLMPNAGWAIAMLLARFSISQMDVPTRQSYTMAVVAPDERAAAAGVTTITRTIASAFAPTITGFLFAASFLSAPFFLAGGLKIVYDLLLYRSFSAVKPPEEQKLA
ncbi:MAG: MFS transporter [Chloroflexi bacterium]|nr:MFS transporter [Chloroflexota bacterium]